MMAKWGKKTDWPTVASRIPPDLKERLKKKHPNDGELSKVIQALLTTYMEGRILGLKITQP